MIGLLLSGLLFSSSFAMAYGGTGSDQGYSVARTGDGGFVLTGSTYSGGAGGADAIIVKLDSAGTLEWAKAYGGAGKDFGYCILETTGGGFLIAGETKSFGSGGSDILLIRTDHAGNLLWATTFGGPLDDYAQSVIQTSDTGFAVAGISYSYGSGNGDCILLKLSPTGNLSWARTYGGARLDLASDLIGTSDGGFLIAGYSFSFSNPEHSDFIIIRTNSFGWPSWTRLFGGVSGDYARSVVVAADGNYVVAGSTYSFGSGQYDFMVLKIDPTGNLIWARTFGGQDMEYAQDVIPTPQAGCVVVGETQDYGAGLHDFMLLNISQSGNLLWARTFGEANADYPRCVVRTPDNGYVIAGYSYSFGAGAYDVLVLRTDTGGQHPGCTQDCLPQVLSASPMTSNTYLGATCNPTTASPSVVVTDLSLTTTTACEAFGAGEGDYGRGSAPSSRIVPGGIVFLSPMKMPLRIFSSDGRLVRSTELERGENFISLETGVYLWIAGERSGRAVVR